MEKNPTKRRFRFAAHTKRFALALLIGAVLSITSAWICAWLNPFGTKTLNQSIVLSDNQLPNFINHWALQTPARVIRGTWIPNRDQLVVDERRNASVTIGMLHLSRLLQFSTPLQREQQSDLMKKTPSEIEAWTMSSDFKPYHTATYAEHQFVYGFPFPCSVKRHVYAAVYTEDKTEPVKVDVSRPLTWLEFGIRFGPGKPIFPVHPWPLGFIANTIFWAFIVSLPGTISRFRKRRRIRKGLCTDCSYPLPTTAGACPECGKLQPTNQHLADEIDRTATQFDASEHDSRVTDCSSA
jgi:hypothetical protein